MLSIRSFVTCIALMSAAGQAQYTLEDDYLKDGDFFSQFDFWTSADPTHGSVKYVDATAAKSHDYANITSSGQAYMGMNYKDVQANGRDSVRITSHKQYNSGLIILDLAHMPGSVCGTWPAFWTVGADWPTNGEIDIIEGVNKQIGNAMTLHTSSGCKNSGSGAMSGHVETSDCDVKAPNQADNQGCGISTTNSATYGDGFNAAGGGVYATEWTDTAIKIFFFGHGSIPSDITSGKPNPSSWGSPVASFDGCNYPSHFKNHQIVFDITTCGDWAGAVWADTCAKDTGKSTCSDYVSNSPEAFAESYWLINSLKVYQSGGSGSGSNDPVPGIASSPVDSATSTIPAVVAPTTSTDAIPPPPPTTTTDAALPPPTTTTTDAAAPPTTTTTATAAPQSWHRAGESDDGKVEVPAGGTVHHHHTTYPA